MLYVALGRLSTLEFFELQGLSPFQIPVIIKCFFKFTPCKAEQPLRSMKFQKMKHKKIKSYGKSVYKEPTVKRCLLILDLKPFRSYVKGKHSIGREFQSLAVRGKKLLT